MKKRLQHKYGDWRDIPGNIYIKPEEDFEERDTFTVVCTTVVITLFVILVMMQLMMRVKGGF